VEPKNEFANRLYEDPDARDSGILEDDLAILAQKEKAAIFKRANNQRNESKWNFYKKKYLHYSFLDEYASLDGQEDDGYAELMGGVHGNGSHRPSSSSNPSAVNNRRSPPRRPQNGIGTFGSGQSASNLPHPTPPPSTALLSSNSNSPTDPGFPITPSSSSYGGDGTKQREIDQNGSFLLFLLTCFSLFNFNNILVPSFIFPFS
jgi:hypothetical protein